MIIRLLPLCAIPILTSLAWAEAPPEAAADLQPVEVSAPAPQVRIDVRAACPSIDASLQHALAMLWYREQTAASMRVDFQVDGDRVTHVRFRGAPWSYRRDIRSAVSRLDCTAPAAGPQHYAFNLEFVDGDAASAPQPHYAVVVDARSGQ